MRRHRLLVLVALHSLAGLLASVALLPLGALPAQASPAERPADPRATRSDGTDEARSETVGASTERLRIEPGEAFMGWSTPAASTRSGDTGRRRAIISRPSFPADAVLGMDVSGHQRTVDWAAWSAQGKRFAYVKATEGTSYRNPYFAGQYEGAVSAGLIRGAYHFANPGGKSGTKQARYFVKHGGGWSDDGWTLPGVLDVEYNPYGKTCYGISKKKTVAWVKAFAKEYKRLTTRDVVIYTTRDWWKRCTGNSKALAKTNPLWVARYSSQVGALPGKWPYYTFWQYSSSPIDQNHFNGSYERLQVLALGRELSPTD